MNRTKANRRILIVVSMGAVLVVLGIMGQLGPIRWVSDHTIIPIARGLTNIGSTAAEALSNLGRVSSLARDNARLAQDNADLRQRLAADAETRSENDSLRKQLGLDVAGAPREVAAEVVAFEPDSYRQFVTINKGSKSGIATGMAVMSEGILIGTIMDVQSSTARIMLVTDPDFKLTAKDQDSGATGIIQGQLGSGLTLDKIGQTDTVKPGDTVTTDGLGGVVPPGLYIGSIQSVNSRANVVFQSAQVETSLRPSALRFAYVVVGS